MNHSFLAEDYFDLTAFPFADIFEDTNFFVASIGETSSISKAEKRYWQLHKKRQCFTGKGTIIAKDAVISGRR